MSCSYKIVQIYISVLGLNISIPINILGKPLDYKVVTDVILSVNKCLFIFCCGIFALLSCCHAKTMAQIFKLENFEGAGILKYNQE